MIELYDISVIQSDANESQRILELIKVINPDRADYIAKKS